MLFEFDSCMYWLYLITLGIEFNCRMCFLRTQILGICQTQQDLSLRRGVTTVFVCGVYVETVSHSCLSSEAHWMP